MEELQGADLAVLGLGHPDIQGVKDAGELEGLEFFPEMVVDVHADRFPAPGP